MMKDPETCHGALQIRHAKKDIRTKLQIPSRLQIVIDLIIEQR